MAWSIPLTDVNLGEEEARAAAQVIRSGWLTQACKVEEFEQAFAQVAGTEHAIAVANGTAALHLAYRAAGLRPGDEFIVPALTFVATMNAGIYLGARPILADCTSEDDLTVSPQDIARKITPRTRLIATMPYGGFCPDMQAIARIANEKSIPIVEDACHAPLAEIQGQRIGSFGIASTFSFFGNKNITTGEGGMVCTNDDHLADQVRLLRSHALSHVTWDRHRNISNAYDILQLGYNYRFDEIRAAIGIEQLRKLPQATERRRQAAALLRQAIQSLGIPGLQIPFQQPTGSPVHHIFVILLPPTADRAQFRAHMHDRGIQTSIHYPLLQDTAWGKQVFQQSPPQTPIATALAPRLVTLPMGPHIAQPQVHQIADALARAL